MAVAFSGGPDSLALLHATCRAAADLQLQVLALHVHHGLLPEADAWLQRAQALVARWRRRGWPVRLAWARLAGAPAPGDSVEAWARAGRHAALNRLAHAAGASLLLLGQHRRDQAETVLQQLLRGAGPAGLAGMPRLARRAGLLWARPWLDQPREAVLAYLQRHHLHPVQDPSNADLRLGRARLRRQLWPALMAGFPDAEVALVQAARRAQEADAALAELAALDLAALDRAKASTAAPNPALDVAAWRGLSAARQANALRAWWRLHTRQRPPDTLVQRLLRELPGSAVGLGRAASAASAKHWPAAGGWVARLHRGVLHLLPEAPAAPAAHGDPVTLNLAQPGWHALPAWGGGFWVEPCAQGGLAPERLQSVRAQARQGGEQWQAGARSQPRSLKKQFQAAGVATWQRQGPLLWQGERLLLVPGLGVDARTMAPAGQAQFSLCWCATAPGPQGAPLEAWAAPPGAPGPSG